MKRSKKRWARTEKELRRDWTYRHRYKRSAPRWYCKTFHVSEKIKLKRELKKVMFGEDPDKLLIFDSHNHKHIATWWWN